MTLDQLRIFVAVAEREHMTRAALSLHATQSAVSAAIAALEIRHDVKLFHRVGRGIALTDAGRIFLIEARTVLARATDAENALAEISGLGRGTLSIVASQTIAGYWLPAYLTRFNALYPAIAIDLAIANTGQAAQLVRDGPAELGFVEGEVDDGALARWNIVEDRMILVGSSPCDQDIGAAWIRNASWVLREPGSGTRSTFERVLREHQIAPEDLRAKLVMPSNEAVRTAVEAGAGVAVLSSLVVDPAISAGTLHALPFALPRRWFYGLRHKERYRGKAADRLLRLICADLESPGIGHDDAL